MARKLLGNFGILWLGILLGKLYLRKVVGKICELRPLYLRVQVPTRGILVAQELLGNCGILWLGIL